MGVNNDIFWSEMGSKFGETGGTSPPRIPRNTPPVDNVANFENVFRLWSARLPLSQFHQQKQITRDAAVTTTIRESKTKIALWTSQFTCRQIVVSFNCVAISPLIFSCGKADVGTSQPKKSHNGFHPCFTLNTSSFSGGTMDFTRWLCIRYRFLKTQVDFGFVEPSDASTQEFVITLNFLPVCDNLSLRMIWNLFDWSILSWFSQLCSQESSSRSLKITLQSGKVSNISSQKKFPGRSTTASAFW